MFTVATLLLLIYLAYRHFRHVAAMFAKKSRPVLHGLQISHYVEKVRWTLDMLNVDYEERDRYAVFGVLLFGETLPRYSVDSRTTLGDSVDILHYLRGRYPDSYLSVELTAAERRLVDQCDGSFGRHVRRFLYGRLLARCPHVVARLWRAGSGPLTRVLSPLLFPLARVLLQRMLHITDASVERSQAQMERTLDAVDALLQRDGRRYLNGHSLSLLDVTFCSLAAPLVMEPLYGGGKLPELDELDERTRAELLPYQSRPFALYCHQIFRSHRGNSGKMKPT